MENRNLYDLGQLDTVKQCLSSSYLLSPTAHSLNTRSPIAATNAAKCLAPVWLNYTQTRLNCHKTPMGTAETSIKRIEVLERRILEEGSPPETTRSLAATSCQTKAGRKHQVPWNVNEHRILWKNSSISGQITQDK